MRQRPYKPILSQAHGLPAFRALALSALATQGSYKKEDREDLNLSGVMRRSIVPLQPKKRTIG